MKFNRLSKLNRILISAILAWFPLFVTSTGFAAVAESKEQRCLQAAILAEARGTSKGTMQAVADVVVNRSKQQGKSVCSILKQPKQFAKLHQVKKASSKNQSEKVKQDLKQSKEIAYNTLHRGSTNKQVLFFHVNGKKYAWTRKLRLVKQDKWHRYYALND